MELGLNKTRVLITGSSRGIGAGIASAFLDEGAKVVLTGRDKKTLEGTQEIFSDKYGTGRVQSYVGDLCESSSRSELCECIASGGLDHLVCNIGSGRSVPTFQEDANEWHRMLEINLVQAACLVKELRPLLAARTKKRGNASITFIGSICGMEAIGCPLPYSSAKAALWAYVKNLVRPLGEDGIRVNQVTPGNILFTGSVWEKKLKKDETV